MGANKGREFELVEVVPFEIQENSNQCDRSADWSIKDDRFCDSITKPVVF